MRVALDIAENAADKSLEARPPVLEGHDPAELLADLCRHLNDDPASEMRVGELKRAAALALLDGQLDRADRLLAEAEAVDNTAANQSLDQNRVRLPFAAATRAARGTLAVLRPDERLAAKHYAAAARSMPFRDMHGRWQLTMAEGRLLRHLGRRESDPVVMTEAIASFKSAVGMLDATTETIRHAQTYALLAETLIEAGGMVGHSIADVQAAGYLETATELYAACGQEFERGAAEIQIGYCLERIGMTRGDQRLLEQAVLALESGLERGGAATATHRAPVARSLASILYHLAELEPSPQRFARAAAALEAIDAATLTDLPEAEATLNAVKLGTALARAGDGASDGVMIRRGIAHLTAAIDTIDSASNAPLHAAARLSLAEALSSLGAHDRAVGPYEDAALIYADIIALTANWQSSLIAAHAYSGLADAMRATAAMTNHRARLTEAIDAKRRAHDIFEKIGHGTNVALMERDLQAMYDLARLLAETPTLAKSA
jgi:tetratricopeptide (TPR) repeat protein